MVSALTVIFVAHVDIVDELRVEAQESLGKVGQERRCVQQAKV